MRRAGSRAALLRAALVITLAVANPAAGQLCGTASVSPNWGGPPGTTIHFSAGGWYGGCHADNPYFWLIDGVPYYWYEVVKSFNEVGHHTWSFCTWQAGCSQCCDDGGFEISGPAAPTPTPGPDLVADAIEVTQGIQDTANSVRLIAGKQTFVRFHVHSRQGDHVATARLRVSGGATTRVVYPVVGNGEITVRANPHREVEADSFLFAFPSGFAKGSVTLRAEVNPGDTPVESERNNNEIAATVLFEAAPRFELTVHAVKYAVGATAYETSDLHVFKLLSWLQNAYPIPGVQLTRRTYDAGIGVPTESAVNRALLAQSMLDLLRGTGSGKARHLGMVSDAGRMPHNIGGGLAIGIPGAVATAFTGTPIHVYAWDTDGSYGDWLAGHELGHTLARSHAEFCGANARNADGTYPAGYVAYPYPDGKLSVPQGTTDQFLGFDLFNRKVVAPPRHELMTYCYNQGHPTWISDFTYEGILDRLLVEGASSRAVRSVAIADRLLIVGTLDEKDGELQLEPILLLPDAPNFFEETGGDHAVVLRNAGGDELARHPVALTESHVDSIDGARSVFWIATAVPHVNGTDRVDIEGPSGVLATVSAGSHTPTVRWIEPSSGAVWADGDASVRWAAEDIDGDPLAFLVQYSADDGATWRVVANHLHGMTTTIDRRDLVASSTAWLRVIASDGIHAAQADVGPLQVGNQPPTLEILSPTRATTIVAAQGVTLQARAYDVDDGLLDDAITWSSSRGGELGSGATLQLNSLSVGHHIVTARATDSAGAAVEATTEIDVVSTPRELPPIAAAIVVAPDFLAFAVDQTTATIALRSTNGASLDWSATASMPWIELGATSGATPSDVVVRARATGLSAGWHAGEVTFLHAEQEVHLPVGIWIEGTSMPCLGDCDSGGAVTVDELIKGVNIALGVVGLTACPTFDGSGDGDVTVDEIVTAVTYALTGCPVAVPTPTRVAVQTPTPSRTPSPAATPSVATATAIRTVTRTPTPSITTSTPTAVVATRTPTPTPTGGVRDYCRTLDPPLAIPDGDEFGVADAMTIEADGEIDQITVGVDITHSWVGDVQIQLLQVDELAGVLLLDRPGLPATAVGCSGSDIDCEFADDAAVAAEDMCSDEAPTLSGRLRPTEPLSSLRGLPMAGLWTLNVADLGAADTGELRGWCLHVRPR